MKAIPHPPCNWAEKLAEIEREREQRRSVVWSEDEADAVSLDDLGTCHFSENPRFLFYYTGFLSDGQKVTFAWSRTFSRWAMWGGCDGWFGWVDKPADGIEEMKDRAVSMLWGKR